MAEYGKHVLGEAAKGLTAAIVGGVIFYIGQQWFTNDLEYSIGKRGAYLSAPLGEQGLSMAFDGKPLDNISIVEFSIANRTRRQFADVELLFVVEDKDSPTLVSAGLIAPQGASSQELISELSTKDPRARKFHLKVVPKQIGNEYFHGVFVFEGETPPEMSVSSTSGEVSIIPYQHWKDQSIMIVVTIVVLFFWFGFSNSITSLGEYFWAPRKHKKQVEAFAKHAAQLKRDEKLKSKDPDALADAGVIFASFVRPKPSKLWEKLLPDQKYEY